MTARWAVRAAELTAVFSPQRKYKTVRFKSHLRNQQVAPKKISVPKTQEPQRFLGFFLPLFKVEFKRYHFSKTTFGEDLN